MDMLEDVRKGKRIQRLKNKYKDKVKKRRVRPKNSEYNRRDINMALSNICSIDILDIALLDTLGELEEVEDYDITQQFDKKGN